MAEPGMTDLVISVEDPRRPDIVALLEAHLELMRRISPPGHVHALDLDGLVVAEVTFLTARAAGDLLGVGALKELGDGRGEVKSMHTTAHARGRGVGRRIVECIIDLAGERRLSWLGLETGSQPEFEPARSLYRSLRFEACEPFGSYTVNPYSTCMALDLTAPESTARR
jgi:putative acetyltransferase